MHGRPRRPQRPAAPGRARTPRPTPAEAKTADASQRHPRDSSKPTRAPKASTVRAGWLGGIRFSGFSLIMMGVLVLAVVVLAPTISAFAEQRQQIAELRAQVSQQESELAKLRAERERWNDETFIVTQARERLYYVLPGEVSYLVIDDRTEAAKADAGTPVSAEVTEAKGDWMQSLLTSVMTAGLAPGAGAPADTPADTPAPAALPDGGTR